MMRIVILTSASQIYSSVIVKRLIEEKFDISGIISSSRILPKRSLFSSLLKIAKDSGYIYLLFRFIESMYHKYLELICPEKYFTVKKVVKRHSIPLHTIKDLNNNAINLIKKLKPDLLISVYFGLIIKKEILDIPKQGCINIHRAPLPKYRGPSSAFWQLSNNEKETAATIHFVDTGVDSGAIISQEKFEINQDDTLHSLCYRSALISRDLLVMALNDIEKGNLQSIKQEEKDATKHPFPTKKAMRNFLRSSRKWF